MDNEITIDIDAAWRAEDGSITDAETIRQLAIYMIENPGNDALSHKIKKECHVYGLYPYVMKFSDRVNYARITIRSTRTSEENEACMWLIANMYTAWAKKREYLATVTDKSDMLEVSLVSARGESILDMLKSESGCHRIVRVSPFDSHNRRHTSFVIVDVLSMSAKLTDDQGLYHRNKVRNYVFAPYKLVTDFNDVETTDVEGVMSGNLELFIK